MGKSAVRFLVFDVESVADPQLVRDLRYGHETDLTPAEAVRKYRDELLAKTQSDFIPYTYQVPVSVVVGKVDAEFRLLDLVALDEPLYRPHVIASHFWKGWEAYQQPTLVSFNGRTFDIPLLELAAFRYGLPLVKWFHMSGKQYDQPRYRYNNESHLDLHDVLTNYGASRFTGGLNLAAHLLGKPGKMDVKGHMVQDMFEDGRLAEINDYCRCDVLDTYFVLLRTAVLLGWLSLSKEHQLIEETKQWVTDSVHKCPAYQTYLNEWGDWINPWNEPETQL